MIQTSVRLLFRAGSAIVALLWLGVSSAQAGAILNFTQGPNPGGTVSYAGGLNPLVGTNIPIYNVTGLGGLANPGDHAIVGSTVNAAYGVLNFVTGAFTGTFGGNDFFAGGGSFVIRGNVPDAGISAPGGAVLVSGSFDPSFGVSILNLGSFNQVSGGGPDTKNPALVDYFGLPSSATWLFSLTTNESGRMPGDNNSNPSDGARPFSFTVNNAAILNETDSTQIAEIPEPASLLLLGTGILGFAVRRRWQRTKR